MSDTPYLLQRPENWSSPILYNSPHSGAHYPSEFLERTVLDALTLRSSEDAFVQRLYGDGPQYGAVMLSAVFPRAWVDLNRSVDEIDPALIEGATYRGLNPRVASGLGVIPRVVSGRRNIYRGKISKAEANARIREVWKPYHRMLNALLEEARQRFGRAVLIDCHSMPREALETVKSRKNIRPQVVIGDRYGASASEQVVAAVEAAFQAEGFKTARNVPFAGAHILRAYGRPAQHRHAVQVEIDRSLYMDEKTLTPAPGFGEIQQRLSAVQRRLSKADFEQQPLAAE